MNLPLLQIAIGSAALASVGADDFNAFSAQGRTGTGSAENIAHGLPAKPDRVQVVLTGGHDGAGNPGTQAGTVTYGTHTSDHAIVTVTAGCTYDVEAW